MKSLRAQIILSHLLPQLLILPLLGVSLAYIIESQILLAELATNLRRVAIAAAQNATTNPAIWQDVQLAEDFARRFSDSLQREIILINPDGELQAIPLGDSEQIPRISSDELANLLAGETLVNSRYNLSLEDMHIEVITPVLDSRQVVVGIVRVTDRLGNVYAIFQSIRNLEIAATLLALLVALGLGIWLAKRTELRLQAIMAAVEQVAESGEAVAAQVTQPVTMPPEFSRVFAAVGALSDRLRASDQARKRLLANVVHEVGRPLGALQAAVHAMQRGAAADPVLRQELLQGMDDQIERLKPLLDNLTSLYMLSSQPVTLLRELIEPGEWLRKILVTWQAAAQAKGLKWQYDLPGELPKVWMDANRMAQVLGNLVANAIQYTPEGGCIRVEAGSDAARIWIAVEDTGIGIPEEERQRIFDPFYRSPGAFRFPQGMGLGLSIAADIVRLHGGDLQLSSELGRGSRFTVYLPVEQDGF